jgi:putative membrane protein
MKAAFLTAVSAALGLSFWIAGAIAQSPLSAGTHDVDQSRSATEVSPADSTVTRSPAELVRWAGEIGMIQVILADLAIYKSRNDDVIKFAKQMEKDHGDANSELMHIAVDMNVPPPKELDPEYQTIVNELSSKSGEDFDVAYIGVMVSTHTRAINILTAASKARNAQLAAFAAKSLPTLQEHKQMAASLYANLNLSAKRAK